jgi:hypothetical protein
VLLAATSASAGWWDDLDRGELVRLGDVFAAPSRYSDRPITFACVVLGRDEVYFPLATPFSEARWDNVAVWDDGAPLWEEETFKRRARPYLYLEKSHPQRDALFRLEPFTRVEVTARVRAVHRSIPFLEILSWRPTGWRLGERVVRAVIRGDNKVREGGEGNLEAALESYAGALAPDLAPVYALPIRKRAADVLRRLGRADEADAMEGTAILGAAPAPPSGPGDPTADAPAVAPPFVSEDLPGRPAEAAAPAEAPPATPGPPPSPSSGPPLVTSDLPGVEVPAAPPAPGLPEPGPAPATPSTAPPATAEAPATGGGGALPPPVVRPTTRDLPPAPAEAVAPPPPAPRAATPAPSAAPPPTPPPAALPPTAPLRVAPPAPAPASPPTRQPRLEGVK